MNKYLIILLTILFILLIGCSPVVTEVSNAVVFNTVELDTGVTLHYAESGPKDGEVIIFIPGYLDSWFSYSRVLPRLSDNYHAYAVTQRGHGESDKPDEFSMDLFAADMESFMNKLNIDKAVIVGHSMGSFIAQRIVINYPDRVSKLVLIGSGVDVTTNVVLLDFETFTDTLTDPIDRDMVYDFQSSTVVSETPEEFMNGIVDESMKVPIKTWQGALAALNATNHTDQLALITMPTLIMWGDHDEIFIEAEQTILAEKIPNATLKIYTDTGHSFQWEKPQEFVDDLEAFLK